MHLQFFFVGFFVDPGPLSPDPTLAGKKEILTQINILNVDFLFFSLYTTVNSLYAIIFSHTVGMSSYVTLLAQIQVLYSSCTPCN